MGTPYIGEIRICGFNFAPPGWASCNGQFLAIADYEPLFYLIGTTYGGDGVTTFQLPDLRGRMPVHTGSGNILGEYGGSEEVTLIATQLPIHTHAIGAMAANGNNASPAARTFAGSPLAAYSTSATPTFVAMAPQGLAQTGGNQPHDNRAPYLGLHFMIAHQGIWPPIP